MDRGGEGRVFLLLQGPMSYFFTYLGSALRAKGCEVHRVLLCPGDVLFWRGPNGHRYTGSIEDWPAFLSALSARLGVTDIVGLGDGRRWHDDGFSAARAAGIRVHVVEQGYIRPHFLCVEPDGTGGRTCFPSDWDKIGALAGDASLPHAPSYKTSFVRYAAMDVGFNLANLLFSWIFFSQYRRHSLDHPVAEWAGWIWNKFIPIRRRRARLADAEARLKSRKGRYYVLPLQLDTDFQIRLHAPTGGVEAILTQTIRSFAAHAPSDALLVIKVHPLDHGWRDWHEISHQIAASAGCAERYVYFDGGDLDAMLASASGTIVANSTVGLSALQASSPVIALGTAIYDLPGLCFEGSLDDFWQKGKSPDPERLAVFLRALGDSIHIPGGFDGDGAEPGADAMAAKMLTPPPY